MRYYISIILLLVGLHTLTQSQEPPELPEPTVQTQISISQVEDLEERLIAASDTAVVETWNLIQPRQDFHISEHRYGPTVMVWKDNILLAGCIGNVVECVPGYEWMLDGAYVRLVVKAQDGSRVTVRYVMASVHFEGLEMTFAS